MELRIPDGVSAMRYCGFPGRASTVVPLFTIAPSRETSMSSAYSTPCPKVPDAVRTGFLSRSPRAASTARSTSASGRSAVRTGVTTAASLSSTRESCSASGDGARSSVSGWPVAASTIDAPSTFASSTLSSSSSADAISSSVSSIARLTFTGCSTRFRGLRQGIRTTGPRSRARPR